MVDPVTLEFVGVRRDEDLVPIELRGDDLADDVSVGEANLARVSKCHQGRPPLERERARKLKWNLIWASRQLPTLIVSRRSIELAGTNCT